MAEQPKATTIRSVGGFDVPPCDLCRREEPCECGGRRNCACTCGRCLYPYPLPDDGRADDGEIER